MINEIIEAIEERILAKVPSTPRVNPQGADSVRDNLSGVYVMPDHAKFSLVGQASLKVELTITIDLVFKHLDGEKQRRAGINILLIWITRALLLQKLGLNITKMLPQGFRNITSAEDRSQGNLVYSTFVSTSFTLEALSEEALDDLLAVGLNYFLKPGDATADAQDVVSLEA